MLEKDWEAGPSSAWLHRSLIRNALRNPKSFQSRVTFVGKALRLKIAT
jgi:hypothetical protein